MNMAIHLGLLACYIAFTSCGKPPTCANERNIAMNMQVQGPSIPPDAAYYVSGLIAQVLRAGGDEEGPWPGDSIQASISLHRQLDVDFLSTDRLDYALDALDSLMSEAFQLMHVGQRNRIWLPVKTQSDPATQSYQVYDLELLAVKHLHPRPTVPDELQSPRK